MPTGNVLIVDDDPEVLEIIQAYLSREGYRTLTARRGSEALSVARAENPDLIILDLILPDLDGLDVCRQLRHELTAPILLLSARSEEIDKILGLTVGGDDYITKPFSPRELVARVKAGLRRAALQQDRKASGQPQHLVFKNLSIDLKGYLIYLNGRQVALPAKEFELLRFLALHPNEIFSREDLYRQIWGNDAFGDSRTVMVHIRRLRERLASYPDASGWIRTVRGVGYKFQPN